MSSRRQKLLARVHWYLQSSLKHITEEIKGNAFYFRGGRYRQVSLYYHSWSLLENEESCEAYLILSSYSFEFTQLYVNMWMYLVEYDLYGRDIFRKYVAYNTFEDYTLYISFYISPLILSHWCTDQFLCMNIYFTQCFYIMKFSLRVLY